MLNPNPYMILSGTFGFSAADLNANRLGQISQHQREAIIHQRSRALLWPVALLVALIAISFLLHIELIVLIFLAACLVSVIIETWQRFGDDLEGHIQTIAGAWTIQKQPFGRTIAVISGQTFSIPKSINTAFMGGVHYRLYYTLGTHTILSAEII